MARKKIVFVIVEGPSDDIAIGSCLDKLFACETVHVEVMHCDITTLNDVTGQNIINKICDVVKKYAGNNSFTRKDFKQIIHIVDTDGAFVDESLVIEDSSVNRPVYNPSAIICKNKSAMIQRNQRKSSVLNRLFTVSEIWSIPYQVYYMSSNLDHVLYDKQNSTDEEKERNAYLFSEKYRNDLRGFEHYLGRSPFSVVNGYLESWAFIKKGNHSLERHSNLALCFPKETSK